VSTCGISGDDFGKVRARAETKFVKAGESIFCEGDHAEFVYFIDSGKVSIYLQKFTVRDEIHTLGPGDCFGEMAVLLNEKRNASASAVEDTRFLTLSKNAFLDLVRADREIADKISALLAARNEELILRETLISSTGIDGQNLHVSIKGDPSLRETALFRERYESFVDRVLPQLTPRLEELLLTRCVFQIFIGFNSGEIRTASLLNPFADEIHQVDKLLDPAYIDRHFPAIPYEQKTNIIGKFYQGIESEVWFNALPPHLKRVWGGYYQNWSPVPPEQISKVVASLPTLRGIQNFYIRNVTIGMVRDAIHMQFNCDGTHIVSAERYRRFLEDNL
jgi:CRP-like cAMP-binding protein